MGRGEVSDASPTDFSIAQILTSAETSSMYVNTCLYIEKAIHYCIEMLGNACNLLNGYLYC